MKQDILKTIGQVFDKEEIICEASKEEIKSRVATIINEHKRFVEDSEKVNFICK